MMTYTGPVKCFDSEEDCYRVLNEGKIVPGDVVVIRYEYPK